MSFEKSGWGDSFEADTLPAREEYGPDENGVRTVVEYQWVGEGKDKKKQKTVTKMKRVSKQTRVSMAAEDRKKNLKPFGKAAEGNEGVTYTSYENVKIEKPGEDQDEGMAQKLESKLKNAFWRRAQRQNQQRMMEAAGIDTTAGMTPDAEGGGMDMSGKYVPPSKRGMGAEASATGEEPEEESTTLRVSNLSADADENDLRELCRRFGGISRVHVAKDHQTGESRGFGFVTFYLREDAERAFQALDGYGYDHLILSVGWARQKKRDPGTEGGLSSGFVSGYGKALPQMPGMGGR